MKNSIEEFLDSNEYWGETENAHNSCLVVEVDKLRDFLASQPAAQGVEMKCASCGWRGTQKDYDEMLSRGCLACCPEKKLTAAPDHIVDANKMVNLIDNPACDSKVSDKAQGVEPVVHIFPHDLKKAETTECKVGVYSVPQGSPDHGKTIPLYKHSEPLRNKAPSCSDNWGIQVVGPDDVYATKSFDEAIKKCAEFNAGILVISEDISQRKNASLYPVVWAKVDRWDAISSAPHCPEITNWDSFLSSPPLEDGMVRVPVEVLDLTRFLANTWDAIDDFVYENCENLSEYPVIQGTRNQSNIRAIGSQDFNKRAIKAGVEFMLKAASKGE